MNWDVEYNVRVCGRDPCKHCNDFRRDKGRSGDIEYSYILPKRLVVYWEYGREYCGSESACLDCLLEELGSK